MTNSRVQITQVTKVLKSYIQFDFPNDLTKEVALEGITIWRKEMPNGKTDLIFICREAL